MDEWTDGHQDYVIRSPDDAVALQSDLESLSVVRHLETKPEPFKMQIYHFYFA